MHDARCPHRIRAAKPRIIVVLSSTPVELTFPLPGDQRGQVVWSGSAFSEGDRVFSVLKYPVGDSGWTDELTDLHDCEAGPDHYIDIASRNHALSRIARWAPRNGVIMDIGCSSGHMLRLLRERIPGAMLVGADYVSGPLEKLAQDLPGIPFLQFDLTTCPLQDSFADTIVALNVLEHIADDQAAICQMFQILKPGGTAIIEVPAGPGLFGIYDRQLMHRRRYGMAALVSGFERCGFRILERSHLGFFFYPAFWVMKKWNQKYPSMSQDEQRRRVVASIRAARENPLMTSVMKIEAVLRERIPMPWGIRCLLVAGRQA